ncbi:MAG TPA: 3-hydroxyacyl-CoA dehydrogenase [Rhodocyclaceae bacterium]|nr:MAG: 3-hydroxyacyl-CoA dehydrogenase [Betaproteobacteria bacterium CG2_30_68_42]PIX75848.1 MAG: 3-hydroxyacyl-CoA dehydrogenase [Rhodocyclales bacterium CG_4_10_14_3_um_filter_68_10]HCX32755.1 3-hydroxyacyl-CoA dehydrogenase [Rhodocyclaceae bacterium]
MTAVRLANPLLEPASRSLPRHVAVIGAGTIGPDIAYYLKSAVPGLRLTLVDIRQEAIDAAAARLREYADKAVARGKLAAPEAEALLRDLDGATDYDAVGGCDWVLEAATEDLALKRRIFADVEARVAEDAMITSNTSSLPAARIFAGLKHPGRATVTHFFAPAWRNPVVEVIDWARADPALVAWLRRFFAATGKVPLATADAPCFMLDRVFDNWCNEAAMLLECATAAEIDSVAGEFVHAGPFFVLNLAHGNPIIVETNTLQAGEEGDHYLPAPIFRSVECWATCAPGRPVAVAEATRARIRDRLLGVLLSQTVDILDRGIGEAADLDLGCRAALGFKRGPLELMDALGDAETSRLLERLSRERPGMPVAKRPLAAYPPRWRHVLVDDLGDVRVITLRRPEALNALHDEMTGEILDAIRAGEHDAGIAGFVLTGYGTKAFCAGADIGRFPSMLGDAGASVQYARACSRLLVHLDAMRKPVVAALNGMALGGGFELAMRCHALVAVKGAWMQLPEVTLGILPAIGAMVVPYRRWPGAAAVFHGMLVRAERLGAERAHELGIVDALAEDLDALFAQALARAHALAGRVEPIPDAPVAVPEFDAAPARAADGRVLSATVVGVIEQAVRAAAAAPTLAAALEVGYEAFGRVACTAAAREGIAAFLERRQPDFGATG